MLPRRRNIVHPLGGEIELPLLVPAFSSKGFIFHRTGKARRMFSELAYVIPEFVKHQRAATLLSAYDLHFDHFRLPLSSTNRVLSLFSNSRIVFLDSGGYELSADFDTTEIKTFEYKPKDGYGSAEHGIIVDKILKDKSKLHLVVANYDHGLRGTPLHEQIREARKLFNKYPETLSDFIIKPWSPKGAMINPDDMTKTDFATLKGFNIIGLTEKELGSNILDRIKRIAAFRTKLNDAGVTAPIHIWGGLDPILTPLYYFAGAEIFDGVSWLRYAYKNGVAINRECFSILESHVGIAASKQENNIMSGFGNLRFLDNLAISLQQWVDYDGKNFDMFDIMIRTSLKQAYDTIRTKVGYL